MDGGRPDSRILDFIRSHHVMALAVTDGEEPWSAPVFYSFDPVTLNFYFLTFEETRHAATAFANPQVSASIFDQQRSIPDVRGLQLSGLAEWVVGEEALVARAAYDEFFPEARGMAAPLWRIEPFYFKLTDNRLGFGAKIEWSRRLNMPIGS